MPIQLFQPTFDIEACLAQIRECLESGWTGLGFKTLEFEQAWCAFTGHPHAHFLNSATSGLHLALNVMKEAHGWADGDEVITSSLTFVSTNHAILYERLTPVFADVDQYLCLNPVEVEKRIGPRTRAVMFVGLGGNTGQIERIQQICSERGLVLLLDAAHMAGTRLRGATVQADAVTYSFQAVKNLPTADSAMVCFNDPEMDAIARKKSWLGINKDTFTRIAGDGAYSWQYDVEYVGFKYNGNSIMAAIGLAQLPHLERDNSVRRQMAASYDHGFGGNDKVKPVPTFPGCQSSRHLYQIEVDRRDELVAHLASRSIYPGVHYRDNTDYPMFAGGRENVPHARRASRRVVSLPLHLRLAEPDVQRVIDEVNLWSAGQA